MKRYQETSVPQRRANKARWRRRESWMPHFATSRARTGPAPAQNILASIAAALGRQMGKSRS